MQGGSVTAGGKRPGAGRPKKNPKDVVSEYVPIHMTPGERKLCERAANSEDLSLAAWGRKYLVAKAERRRK